MSPAELERAWEEAVRSALLGTGRQPSADPAGAAPDAPALDRALAALADRSAEARLLGTAGVLSVYRRAGRLPPRDASPLPDPAPEETAPRVPVAAARWLATMLEGEGAGLLPEWLERAAARGAAAPPELLPALLERGTKKEELREGVVAVLGARGRWLAAFEPAWRWAASGAAGDEDEAWATGSAETRVAVLARLRRADPARGLALVRSTWDADAHKDRAAFVHALAAGLSDADEPFLEAALDDRRKEVRAAAAEVLAGLPTSRLAARATERARAWVRLSAPSGGPLAKVTGAKAKLAVDPPKACTPEMERDGVEPKPRRKGGQRAWWLEQVVAAVPPAVWTAEAPPETWIAAARGGDWADPLLAGWAAAAARHRDPAWAEALVRLGAAGTYQAALFTALAPDVYRSLARSRVERQRTLHGDEESVLFVARSPYPLGRELTEAVLARVSPKALENDWAMRDWLRLLAARLDPAAALDAVTAWEPAPRGAWVDLLHARHALHEAFAS